MQALMIRLDDLPAEGREFIFSEQDFWIERFDAFNMSSCSGRNIQATVHVMPQESDALIRGTITGSVCLPCDSCAESYEQPLDLNFEEYEASQAESDGDEIRIENDRGVLTLDIGAVLWEQFMLALPVKPTCAPSCKGICPQCGVNLNEEECTCDQEMGDARLAVFRDLKLK